MFSVFFVTFSSKWMIRWSPRGCAPTILALTIRKDGRTGSGFTGVGAQQNVCEKIVRPVLFGRENQQTRSIVNT